MTMITDARLDECREFLRSERGLSPQTVATYAHHLRGSSKPSRFAFCVPGFRLNSQRVASSTKILASPTKKGLASFANSL